MKGLAMRSRLSGVGAGMVVGSSWAEIFAILILMALPPGVGSTMDRAGIIVRELTIFLLILVSILVSRIVTILLVFTALILVERDLLILLI